MKHINRKTFFKGLALGTLSLPLFLRGILGNTQAQQAKGDPGGDAFETRYRWRMVTTWPAALPVIAETCHVFADLVKAMSGGRMEIKVYGAGELVPALETFDTVRSGGAEMGSGAAYYWSGKVPAAQFFASVPFGMNAQQLTTWIVAGGGQALWEELYSDFGLVPMLGGNTGVQMGGWFNREINSVADFKGLKMRIPGLGGRVLEKAGGAPVLMHGGELYTGLERGVIDALEWLGPFHDYKMDFQSIAKYYYSPGWQEPGTALEFIFNKAAFDELPADLRAILRGAALYANTWCLSGMEANNSEYLSILRAQGVDIRSFPPEVIAHLRRLTAEVITELTERDAAAQKIYASYSAFREKAIDWAGLSEKIFYNELQI